jgi:hypothetical protein
LGATFEERGWEATSPKRDMNETRSKRSIRRRLEDGLEDASKDALKSMPGGF